jgi:hypothetical protein
MLEITDNGKPVPYFSMLYQDHLIAGIKPVAGVTNQITVRFRGLLWANFISSTMWGIWALCLVYMVLRKISPREVHE